MKKSIVSAAIAFATALTLTTPVFANEKITVAASPTPHAEILNEVKDILGEQGYELEVI